MTGMPRRYYSFCLLLLLLGGALLYWLWMPLSPSFSSKDINGNTARGAYLARISGCIACHTDIDSGGKFLSGGKPLTTPFGDFRAPNLTSDPKHGIGAWTFQQFSTALREGISPEGKPYYPAFPYTFYEKFSDQDVADLWVAFQTVPPVAEPDPEQSIMFPFNFREGLKVWRAMFFSPSASVANSASVDQLNRGKFLVEVAAHCGACHTPRNLFGALNSQETFAGGYDANNNKVPAITAANLKENGWTEDDLAYALQTGIKHDGDVFGGSMSEVVEHSTGYMSWNDLKAVAQYLLTP